MRPTASLLRVRNITELVTATTYTCNIFLATLEHAPTPTCRNDVGEAAVGGGEVVRVVWGRALSWVPNVNRLTWFDPRCVYVRQLRGRKVAEGLLPFLNNEAWACLALARAGTPPDRRNHRPNRVLLQTQARTC